MKQKEYTLQLSAEDRMDVIIMREKEGKITKFSLNYRTMINGKWVEVYRVDNYHGFLHEQRHWRSSKPIPLDDNLPLNLVVKDYMILIKDDYGKYRNYYEEKMKKERNEENEKKRRIEQKKTKIKSRRH